GQPAPRRPWQGPPSLAKPPLLAPLRQTRYVLRGAGSPAGGDSSRATRFQGPPSRTQPPLLAPLRKPRHQEQAPAPPQEEPPPGRHSQGPPSRTQRQLLVPLRRRQWE